MKIKNTHKGYEYNFSLATRVNVPKRFNIANMSMPGSADDDNHLGVLTAIMGANKEVDVSFAIIPRTDDYTNNTGSSAGFPDKYTLFEELKWLSDYVFAGSNKLYKLTIGDLEFNGTINDFTYDIEADTSHSVIYCSFCFIVGQGIGMLGFEDV